MRDYFTPPGKGFAASSQIVREYIHRRYIDTADPVRSYGFPTRRNIAASPDLSLPNTIPPRVDKYRTSPDHLLLPLVNKCRHLLAADLSRLTREIATFVVAAHVEPIGMHRCHRLPHLRSVRLGHRRRRRLSGGSSLRRCLGHSSLRLGDNKLLLGSKLLLGRLLTSGLRVLLPLGSTSGRLVTSTFLGTFLGTFLFRLGTFLFRLGTFLGLVRLVGSTFRLIGLGRGLGRVLLGLGRVRLGLGRVLLGLGRVPRGR